MHHLVISKVDLPLPQLQSTNALPNEEDTSSPSLNWAIALLMSLPSIIAAHFLLWESLKASVQKVLVPATLTTTAPVTCCSQLHGTTLAKSKRAGLIDFPVNPSRTLPSTTWKSTMSIFPPVRLTILMGWTPQLSSMWPWAMKEGQQQYLTLWWWVKRRGGQTLEEVEMSILFKILQLASHTLIPYQIPFHAESQRAVLPIGFRPFGPNSCSSPQNGWEGRLVSERVSRFQEKSWDLIGIEVLWVGGEGYKQGLIKFIKDSYQYFLKITISKPTYSIWPRQWIDGSYSQLL